MGMRVIIARQELKPLDFADPHLFVHKDAPATSSLPPAVQTAQKVDPGTQSDAIDPAASAAASAPQPGAQATPVQGSATPQPAGGSATSAGAAPAQSGPPDSAASGSGPAPSLADIVKAAAADASAPTKAPQPTPTKPGESAANAGTTPAPSAAPAATTPAQPAGGTNGSASAPQPASAPAQSGVAAAPSAPSQTPPPAPSVSPAPPASPPASVAAAPAASAAPISLDEVPLPLSRPEKIAQGADAPIAIFISRKEGKIYVRQNFTPVFEAPIKIDHPEQPLGTYVFTAMDYMPDHSTFHWTLVTMPYAPERAAEKYKYVRDYYGRLRRVRLVEHAADTDAMDAPPETAQQALARIHIPQDAIDQISQLMVPGSSLIISDQGLGRETGRGTDFIVVQRW
jgi:hypothetical protein